MEDYENGNAPRIVAAAIIIVFLGFIAGGVWVGYNWWRAERTVEATTDSSEIRLTIRVVGDDYAGYNIWNSQDLRTNAANIGIVYQFAMEFDYKKRIEMLYAGEADVIFMPVSEFVRHGGPDYKAAAFQGIALSIGADVIYAKKNAMPNGQVSDLNDPTLKWVFVGGSVSETLIDAAVRHLDLSALRQADPAAWKVPVASMDEVFARAKSGNGDVFVFWEPTASRAQKEIPDLQYVIGSDIFRGIITDAAFATHDYMVKHSDELTQLLECYHTTMRGYENDPERMIAEFVRTSPVKTDAETMKTTLSKINFLDLKENASLQFGIPSQGNNNPSRGLDVTIAETVRLLRDTKVFASDPLSGNYGRITNKKLLAELVRRMPMGPQSTTAVKFAQLDEEGWKRLEPIAALHLEPIEFEPNSDVLSPAGEAAVDLLAPEFVNHFPTVYVAIGGHTEWGEDEPALIKLSLDRAKAVMKRLTDVHKIDPNRLHAVGFGFSVPPPRRKGETERQYRGRLPRVEFMLLENPSSL